MGEMSRDLDRGMGTLRVLGDDLRRRLYLLVRAAGRPVSREEMAERTGISRALAAFHLDKLAAAGLLRFHYERPRGRSGPGAGRSAKFYEPSGAEVAVSIPERRYDVLGGWLVGAVREERAGESGHEAAARVAARKGRAIGRAARREAGYDTPARALTAVERILRREGYEPRRGTPGEIWLRNCPFHALAREDPDVVCAANHAFIRGLVRGMGAAGVQAALDPAPGRCCVVLRARESGGRGAGQIA